MVIAQGEIWWADLPAPTGLARLPPDYAPAIKSGQGIPIEHYRDANWAARWIPTLS